MMGNRITIRVNQLERGAARWERFIGRAFLRPVPRGAVPSAIRDGAMDATIGMVRMQRARQNAAPLRGSEGK